MSVDYCPICYTKLQVKEVAPCMECGHLEEEIVHFESHTFSEMRIFGELSLVLCDFCQVDFGSYNPEFFGLSRSAKIGYEKMSFVGSINNVPIKKDKYCPECHHRIQFLKFVADARDLHQLKEEENL
jgi:hypothetical protein